MDLKESELLGETMHQHWYYRAKIAAVQRLLHGSVPTGILDVGAGSGFFTRQLLEHGSAREAWCIDTGYPKDHTEQSNGKAIHFQRQFSAVPADLILLMDVLEHVDDDLALLRDSLAASTVAEARVLISVPAFQWLWSSHDDFLGHRRRYRLGQLNHLVSSAGLTIELACYYYGLILPLAVATRVAPRLVARKRPTQQPVRSQLRRHSSLVNGILLTLCQAELPLLPYNRVGGLSLFCLARRHGVSPGP